MNNGRVIITYYGGPEALRVVEEEYPEPKRGEVHTVTREKARAVGLPITADAIEPHSSVRAGVKQRDVTARTVYSSPAPGRPVHLFENGKRR